MTVKQLADQLNLWQRIECACTTILAEKTAAILLKTISTIPVQCSRATRRLGVYVSLAGKPCCIRLQFAQELESLTQTFLHEVAHACDHLSRKSRGKGYPQAHGESWKNWARALEISTKASAESEAVRKLHHQRLKLVAVCTRCGAEFHRVRRLNKNRTYTHDKCGGKIQQI